MGEVLGELLGEVLGEVLGELLGELLGKLLGELHSFATVDATGCKWSSFLIYHPLAGRYVLTGMQV